MPKLSSVKDKKSWLKVISGICGNLAAGWFGLILISPRLTLPLTLDGIFLLTRSLIFGIVFMIIAQKLERQSL